MMVDSIHKLARQAKKDKGTQGFQAQSRPTLDQSLASTVQAQNQRSLPVKLVLLNDVVPDPSNRSGDNVSLEFVRILPTLPSQEDLEDRYLDWYKDTIEPKVNAGELKLKQIREIDTFLDSDNFDATEMYLLCILDPWLMDESNAEALEGKDLGEVRKEMRDLLHFACSIKDNGLLQHPIVTPDSSGRSYTIVVGERRIQALTLLGKDQEKMRVANNLDDKEALDAQAAENSHRKDLMPHQKAGIVFDDIEAYMNESDKLPQWTYIAQRHNIQRSAAYEYLNVFKNGAELIPKVVSGELSIRAAVAQIAKQSKKERAESKALTEAIPNKTAIKNAVSLTEFPHAPALQLTTAITDLVTDEDAKKELMEMLEPLKEVKVRTKQTAKQIDRVLHKALFSIVNQDQP